MPLNPPPTISDGLCLITQKLARSDMSRAAEVTFGLVTPAGGALAQAQDTVDDFQANFNGTIGTLIDSEVFIYAPTVRMGNGSQIPFEAVAAGASIVGTNPGAFPPPNVALLVKKTTGVGGRKNRGRTYYPYTVASAYVSENGSVDPTYINAANTVFGNFLAALTTDASAMVIVNKTYNQPAKPHHVTAITAGPTVTAYKVESKIATQRRRLER